MFFFCLFRFTPGRRKNSQESKCKIVKLYILFNLTNENQDFRESGFSMKSESARA